MTSVTNASWKAKKFSWGPVDGDMQNPRVENIALPDNWYSVDFDDSQWPHAKEYSEEEVGPKEPYFEHDFAGAKFIWTDDVKLDNVVLFRTVVKSPPDGKERTDFRGLTDTIPQQPQRGGGGGPGRGSQRGPGQPNRKEFGSFMSTSRCDTRNSAGTSKLRTNNSDCFNSKWHARCSARAFLGLLTRSRTRFAMDFNRDGQIDQAELRGAADALHTLDTNKDGRITADELRGGLVAAVKVAPLKIAVAQMYGHPPEGLPVKLVDRVVRNPVTGLASHGFWFMLTKLI